MIFSISNAHAEKRVRLPWPMRRKCVHSPKKKRGGGRVLPPSRPYGKRRWKNRLGLTRTHAEKTPVSLRFTGERPAQSATEKHRPLPFREAPAHTPAIHTPRRERPLLVILLHASLLTRAAESSLLVRNLPSHRRDVCNGGLSSQRLTPPRYVLALTVPFAWGLAPRSFEAAA